MTRLYKIVIVIAIFGFLFSNVVQHEFRLRKIYPLKGINPVLDTIPLSVRSWFKGSYQFISEEKVKNNFGFSNLLVRLNSQIAYSFFDVARGHGVIIGKDDYLFEKNYINAYYGLDYLGEDSILKTVRKLKVIQDSLEKHNKHLLVVFCPGKASYYPDKIPDKLQKPKTDKTNMLTYIRLAEKEKLNYLDLYHLFLEKKKTSKHVLYPKYGIHWSNYGDYIALMEIHKVLKNKFKLPQPTIDLVRIERSLTPKERDIDITEGINLLVKPTSDTLSYPVLKIRNKPKSNPDAIVISDSFYWCIFEKNKGMGDNSWTNMLFDDNDFWYYNKEAYNNKVTSSRLISNVNLSDEINKNDVFIFMATESTIFELGWGAIDRFYNEILHTNNPYKPVDRYKDRIAYWKEMILNDPKWLKDAEIRGNQMGISLDSSITLDAKYQADIGH